MPSQELWYVAGDSAALLCISIDDVPGHIYSCNLYLELSKCQILVDSATHKDANIPLMDVFWWTFTKIKIFYNKLLVFFKYSCPLFKNFIWWK